MGFPSGWDKVRSQWDGLCSYTAQHGAPRSLCNVPSNTHSWQYAKDQPKFMCGKVKGSPLWNLGLSKGGYGNKDIGHAEFNKLFANSPNKIVKRVCSGCRSEYKEMYYRRYSSPSNVNVYDLMKQNWKSHNNVVNKDFGIFSSYADAVSRQNPWKFCDYNDPGIGFPRDCGKTGGVGHQWNSWTRGGQAVAYYVEGEGDGSSPFVVSLGAKNGVKGGRYEFRIVKASRTSVRATARRSTSARLTTSHTPDIATTTDTSRATGTRLHASGTGCARTRRITVPRGLSAMCRPTLTHGSMQRINRSLCAARWRVRLRGSSACRRAGTATRTSGTASSTSSSQTARTRSSSVFARVAARNTRRCTTGATHLRAMSMYMTS